MLNERSKAGKKREPAAASKHLLVSMKITIPVWPSMGSHTNNDWSWVNDDCLNCRPSQIANYSQKKSHIGDFEPCGAKTATL